MDSENVSKGIRGIVATGGGIAISLANLEEWLRITSLCVGIAVGIATLISILRNMKKK